MTLTCSCRCSNQVIWCIDQRNRVLLQHFACSTPRQLWSRLIPFRQLYAKWLIADLDNYVYLLFISNSHFQAKFSMNMIAEVFKYFRLLSLQVRSCCASCEFDRFILFVSGFHWRCHSSKCLNWYESFGFDVRDMTVRKSMSVTTVYKVMLFASIISFLWECKK